MKLRRLRFVVLVLGTNKSQVVRDLSNGAIFNDLELPLLPISRLCHYLMLNISETLRDTHIVSMEY